jgi:hypothetical protein
MSAAVTSLAAVLVSARQRGMGLVLGLLVVLGVVLPTVWSRKPERRAAAYCTLSLLLLGNSPAHGTSPASQTGNGLPDSGAVSSFPTQVL